MNLAICGELVVAICRDAVATIVSLDERFARDFATSPLRQLRGCDVALFVLRETRPVISHNDI
jgi:hypothetical protein